LATDAPACTEVAAAKTSKTALKRCTMRDRTGRHHWCACDRFTQMGNGLFDDVDSSRALP
jgi:hypothetical protein